MPRYTMFTEKKIEEFIRNGRGQGEGANYQPWLTIHDVPSRGRSHRIQNPYTGRTHHFFSDLEARYFYILLWSERVVDIREQFPLFPVSDTEQIARSLNVKHPQYSDSKVSCVMTTDFLITVRDGNQTHFEARSLKYESDLEKRRTLEKQAIEERYWAQRGIQWKVVTEKAIDVIKANNIKKVMQYYHHSLDLGQDDMSIFATSLKRTLLDHEGWELSKIAQKLDIQLGLLDGSSIALFFHLVAHKQIPVDMSSKAITPASKIENIVALEILANMLTQEGGYIHVDHA